MSLINVIGIAVALAMDAFAVSIAVGISLNRLGFRQIFRLSFHFGLFQALMTIIGWAAGLGIRSFVEQYALWIAFGLLVLIGANMFREGLRKDETDQEEKDSTRGLTMVMLSVATSIDALAVGFSLSLLNIVIAFPAVIIGLVALLFTIVGLHLGSKAGSLARLSHIADFIGALVLWGIGIKILFQNLI